MENNIDYYVKYNKIPNTLLDQRLKKKLYNDEKQQ